LDDYSDAQISIKDDYYNIIYSRLSLQYFNRDITKTLLKVLQSKLKPGGNAYIALKSPKDTAEFSYLQKTAKKIEPGLFDDHGILKNRFRIDDLFDLLNEAGIVTFQLKEVTENFANRKDSIKSGSQELLLNEIRFSK